MALPEHEPSRRALLRAAGYHSKLSAKAKRAAWQRAEARWQALQERFASPWVPDPVALQRGDAQLPTSEPLLDLAGGDAAEAERRLAVVRTRMASDYHP